MRNAPGSTTRTLSPSGPTSAASASEKPSKASLVAQRMLADGNNSPGRGGLLPVVRSRFSAEHPDATLTLRQVGWGTPTAGLADEPRLVAVPLTHPLSGRLATGQRHSCRMD